jgi:hypothetical protein
MKPISLEIVTRVMTSFNHCSRCAVLFDESGLQQKFNQKTLDDYPQDLIEEFARLSDWIRELARLYKHRLQIRLIDAQSWLGMYKSLRHRIRKYPTFIIERKETYVGWDKTQLEGLLDKYIQASVLARKQTLHSLFSQ